MANEVLVKTAGLVFPPLCPCCGGVGDRPIECRRAFPVHDDSDQMSYAVVSHAVCFCSVYAARHAAARQRANWTDHLRRLFSDPGTALGRWIVLIVGLFFLREAATSWLRFDFGDIGFGTPPEAKPGRPAKTGFGPTRRGLGSSGAGQR